MLSDCLTSDRWELHFAPSPFDETLEVPLLSLPSGMTRYSGFMPCPRLEPPVSPGGRFCFLLWDQKFQGSTLSLQNFQKFYKIFVKSLELEGALEMISCPRKGRGPIVSTELGGPRARSRSGLLTYPSKMWSATCKTPEGIVSPVLFSPSACSRLGG